MKITWFGTASIRIENEQGAVLIDPFVRDYEINKQRLIQNFRRNDTILITHGHFDHIAHIYQIFQGKENVRIYGTQTPIQSLMKDGMEKEKCTVIEPNTKFFVNGFEVVVKKGKHIKFDRAMIIKTIFSKQMLFHLHKAVHYLKLWSKNPENEEMVIYELIAENKRIQIIGSAGMEETETYQKGADLLLLAYQGRDDLVTYIPQIIEKFSPNAVMPIHFDNSFSPLSSDVDMESFEQMMKKQFPQIKMMIPQLDLPYTI